METYIEKFCEFMGTPNIKMRAIMSEAVKAERATTIPEVGVHSSEWKRKTPEKVMI